MGVSVTISGIEGLKKYLSNYDKVLTQGLADEIKASAINIEKNAKRLAPVNFGNLRRSIHFVRIDKLTYNGKKYVEQTVDATTESVEAIDLTKDEYYIAEQERLKALNKAELDSLDVIDSAKKANADMLLTEQELAIQKENESYKIKIDNALKFGQDIEALELEHLNNLNNINLTAQEKQYALDKETSEKKIALEKETAEKQIALENNLRQTKPKFCCIKKGNRSSLLNN